MAKIFTNSSYFENIERVNAGAQASGLSRMNVANGNTAQPLPVGFSTVLAEIEKDNRKNVTNSLQERSFADDIAENIMTNNLAAMERYDSIILGRPTNYRAYLAIPTPPTPQPETNVLSNINQKIVPNSGVSLQPGDNNLAPNTESALRQAEGSRNYAENTMGTIQKHADKIREYLSSLVKKNPPVSNSIAEDKVPAPEMSDKNDIKKIIKIAGQYHGLDPVLALAVAKTESSLRPNAVSKDGHESKGIFQLLDGTAANMIKRFKIEEKYQPFDPKMNSHLGVGYLRYLHDIFSENTKISKDMVTFRANSQDDLEKLALAAYNAGEGRVIRAQEKAKSQGDNPGDFEAVKKFLPEMTRGYVMKVATYKDEINENSLL